MHRMSKISLQKPNTRAPHPTFVPMECTEWKNDPAASAPPIPKSPHELIHGTGEMADLTRAFDWSETPVGPVEQWPDTLLITVNTLLASRFPMFLWWGEELTQFY